MATRSRNLPDVWRNTGLSQRDWSPLRHISRLQRNIDRIFDDFLSPVSALTETEQHFDFIPAVDVEETDDRFMLSLDLPGVNKDDVKIEIQDNQLLISGHRKQEHEHKDSSRVSIERIYGEFQRAFTIPSQVDPEKIEAVFQDGVLHVAVPKVESAKPKMIEIKEAKNGKSGRLLGQEKKSEKAA